MDLKYSFVVNGEQISIGLVFDGSGGAPHSETGVWMAKTVTPKIFSQLFATAVNQERLTSKPGLIARDFYPAMQQAIRKWARALQITKVAEFDQFVFDCCMFTIVGFIITPRHLVTFRAGDGVILINNKLQVFATPIGQNTPSYIGHTLISEKNPRRCSLEQIGFDIKQYQRTSAGRVLVATDGLAAATQLLSTAVWQCKTDQDVQSELNILHSLQATSDDMALVAAQWGIQT
jgi:hypothetical protein